MHPQVPPHALRATYELLRAELGMSASQAATAVLQQPKLLKREPEALVVCARVSVFVCVQCVGVGDTCWCVVCACV